MSVKRALEYNFKTRLSESFIDSNVNITESSRLEERVLPCIILDAGTASLAVDHPDNMDNFDVNLDLIILTNFDEMNVNSHKDIVDKCLRKMIERDTRTKSIIQYLHLYSTTFKNTTEENADRKTATHISYSITCHYSVI